MYIIWNSQQQHHTVWDSFGVQLPIWEMIEVSRGIQYNCKFYALRLRGFMKFKQNRNAFEKFGVNVRGPLVVEFRKGRKKYMFAFVE